MSAWSDFFLGWAPAEWTTDSNEAHERYITHLSDMQSKQNWPSPLIQVLTGKAEVVKAQSDTADEYWSTIYKNEIGWIKSVLNPNQLKNLPNHVAFLESVADASGSWADVLNEYSFSNVIKETTPTPDKFWESKVPLYMGGLFVAFLAVQYAKAPRR